jgi:exosortase
MVPFKEVSGLFLCMIAYLFHGYSSRIFYTLELNILSMPLFIGGVILIMYNIQTLRTLLFPLCFMLLLIPPPIQLLQQAGVYLSSLSTNASYSILSLLQVPVSLSYQFSSPVIYLERGEEVIPFAIDIACSGLNSLTGFIIFAIFIAYISNTKPHRKILIFILGLPLNILLNILRITIIIIIGYYTGVNLALQLFHLFGGWVLILVSTLLMLLTLDRVFKIQFFNKQKMDCEHIKEEENMQLCLESGRVLKIGEELDRKKLLLFITVLSAAIFLRFVQVPSFSLVEGKVGVFSKAVTGDERLGDVLPDIKGYQARFVYRDTEFEKVSGQNASLIYQYISSDQGKPIIWIGIEIGASMNNLHPWEVCLITWPESKGREPGVEKLDLTNIQILENPPLTGRYFAFRYFDSDTIQSIIYWYSQAQFETDAGYERK